jgi:SAM-dependent methyltransferase
MAISVRFKGRVKKRLPEQTVNSLRQAKLTVTKWKYRLVGRPLWVGETAKARARREKEGFFVRYCRGRGLDVGYGGDLVSSNARGYDIENGNAQTLSGIPDESFDFVHSSHVLEHMVDVKLALQNWWRVVNPRGYLLLLVPDRDLYEKRQGLPSRWNADHKHFFLLDRDDLPDTLALVPLIERTLPKVEFIYSKICDEGHTVTDPAVHSDGEYSIEVVLRKPR